MKKESIKDFRRIPGVGKEIAEDLWQLGFKSVSELKNKDPEKLYERLCQLQGCKVDRCMLYVFRCAVYFASNETHDLHLLKWWNWKDNKEQKTHQQKNNHRAHKRLQSEDHPVPSC